MMSPLGKGLDAAAAAVLAIGIQRVAFGADLPGSIEAALPQTYGDAWAIWLFLAATTTVAGVLLRTESERSSDLSVLGRMIHVNRKTLSMGMEYGGWLSIAGMALIYGGAVLIRFGAESALVTVGIAFGLAFLTLSKWLVIHRALNRAKVRSRGTATRSGSRDKGGI